MVWSDEGGVWLLILFLVHGFIG
jgi:hypothetical protein